MSPENEFRKKLGGGIPSFGTWLLTPFCETAEILALAGLDFLLIDHADGQRDIEKVVCQLRAVQGTGCAGFVRIPNGDHDSISRILEAGAQGILVANVDSAAQARAIVAACRRAARGDPIVGVQVENPAAVSRLPQIAAVEGIDLIFIDPRNLSSSMGKRDRTDDPEVRAEIERAEQAVLKSGKLLGSTASGGKAAAEMAERGYQFIVPGSEAALLHRGAKAMLEEARPVRSRRYLAVESIVGRPTVVNLRSLENSPPCGAAAFAGGFIAGTGDVSPADISPAEHLRKSSSGLAAIQRMRQFWFAWAFAMALLAIAVIGGAYVIAISSEWPFWTMMGARSAAALLAALAVYDAYRLAVKGTWALQDALAYNLAVLVTIELEDLQATVRSREQVLSGGESRIDAIPIGADFMQGFRIPDCLRDRQEVQRLLGAVTEEKLRKLLSELESFNAAIANAWRESRQPDVDPAAVMGDLRHRIRSICEQLNAAIGGVSARLGRPARL